MTLSSEGAVSAESGEPTVTPPREELATQLRQLEEFVARTESQGDEMPPEAAEMVARLREIMQALDGLSASFGDVQSPPMSNNTKREPT
jgi:hypothetical protein